MRYRATNKGGRPFAKPQLLDKDIQAMKTRASASKPSQVEQERRNLLATITMQSVEAAGRDEIAGKIMGVLKGADQGYVHKSSPGELAEGEWRQALSSEGHLGWQNPVPGTQH